MVEETKKIVRDELKDFLEAEVMPRIRHIKQIAEDPETPKAVALAADNSILDRFLGKPNQPITTGQTDPSKLSNEELERRVSSIVANIPPTTGNS